MGRSRATLFIHTTTNCKPPYMMGVWVYLNLNQYISIQYTIYSEVGSYKSVLCRVSTGDRRLVLEKCTPTDVTNSHEEFLTHFIPDKFYTYVGIRKILSKNPFIKIHPKIISCDQLIANIIGRKSDKSIWKMARLPLPFK